MAVRAFREFMGVLCSAPPQGWCGMAYLASIVGVRRYDVPTHIFRELILERESNRRDGWIWEK
ncbi:hypothetical protein D3C76_884870 [compost metagenome]